MHYTETLPLVLSVQGPQMSSLMEVSCDPNQRVTIFIQLLSAIVQTTSKSFDLNGESSLDLEYAMGLTNPQPITLLQTGDDVEGQ